MYKSGINREEEREEDIHRTIRYLIKNLPIKKQRKVHDCEKKYCKPINVKKILSNDEIREKMFDDSVWVCQYQKIHICNGNCLGEIENSENKKLCRITHIPKETYIHNVAVSNPKAPQDKTAEMPQHQSIIDGHRSKTNIIFKMVSVDQYYNDIHFNIDQLIPF